MNSDEEEEAARLMPPPSLAVPHKSDISKHEKQQVAQLKKGLRRLYHVSKKMGLKIPGYRKGLGHFLTTVNHMVLELPHTLKDSELRELSAEQLATLGLGLLQCEETNTLLPLVVSAALRKVHLDAFPVPFCLQRLLNAVWPLMGPQSEDNVGCAVLSLKERSLVLVGSSPATQEKSVLDLVQSWLNWCKHNSCNTLLLWAQQTVPKYLIYCLTSTPRILSLSVRILLQFNSQYQSPPLARLLGLVASASSQLWKLPSAIQEALWKPSSVFHLDPTHMCWLQAVQMHSKFVEMS